MTKQQAFHHFYNRLSESERENGPEGLPEFVSLICSYQPQATDKVLAWVQTIAVGL
jgi:hypothetical protein